MDDSLNTAGLLPPLLPALQDREHFYPSGRAQPGLGQGCLWFLAAWRLFCQGPVLWALLTLPLLGLCFSLWCWPQLRGLSLSLLVPSLALFLAPGVALQRGAPAALGPALALVYLGRGRLSGLAASACLLWYGGLPLLRAAGLGGAAWQALWLLGLLSALVFAPALCLGHGLGVAQALRCSVLGVLRNGLNLLELVLAALFASVLVTGPLFYLCYLLSGGQVSFVLIEVLSALGALGVMPSLVLALFTAYRAIYIGPAEEA